jgi:surface antigen
MLVLALPAGGCSYQLGSMFSQDSAKSDVIGSIPSSTKTARATSAEADLAYARVAATKALAIDGKTTSVPWENPQTGARGTITPIASAYTQDGFVCRDFLASYVHEGAESWLQGEGCRVHEGRWEIRLMKPWKKT